MVLELGAAEMLDIFFSILFQAISGAERVEISNFRKREIRCNYSESVLSHLFAGTNFCRTR